MCSPRKPKDLLGRLESRNFAFKNSMIQFTAPLSLQDTDPPDFGGGKLGKESENESYMDAWCCRSVTGPAQLDACTITPVVVLPIVNPLPVRPQKAANPVGRVQVVQGYSEKCWGWLQFRGSSRLRSRKVPLYVVAVVYQLRHAYGHVHQVP